jgi:tetratricopeptide (TPR) repeat protein
MPRRTPLSSTATVFPPAPLWPRDETVLLGETDAPLSLLLWQRARDVRLWATADPSVRARLFAGREDVERGLEATAGLADGVAGAVRLLGALVRYPEFIPAAEVCAACLEVSEWADGSHMPETALHFAEAAALADPGSAEAAAVAGSACANQAADQRAAVWFFRSIRTARRLRNWEWYSRALIRLALLHYELGEHRRARRAGERACSSAEWSGHYTYAAKAHHALLLVECADGSYAGGERHARRALELYPHQFTRLPHLAHDYAYLLTCHGGYAAALTLLDAALPFFTLPWERIAIYGTVAKAAAGLGHRARHSEAVADILLLAAVSDTHAAGALVLAAEGAHLLGDRERAVRLAEYGLGIAEERREREPRRRARLVLDAVAAPAPAIADLPAEGVASTTALFLQRLKKLRAPTDAGEARAEMTQFTMSGRG